MMQQVSFVLENSQRRSGAGLFASNVETEIWQSICWPYDVIRFRLQSGIMRFGVRAGKVGSNGGVMPFLIHLCKDR